MKKFVNLKLKVEGFCHIWFQQQGKKSWM